MMKTLLVAVTVSMFFSGGILVWEAYSLKQSVRENITKYADYGPRGVINDHEGEELFPAWPSSMN